MVIFPELKNPHNICIYQKFFVPLHSQSLDEIRTKTDKDETRRKIGWIDYPAHTYNILCILSRDFEFYTLKPANELQNSPHIIPILPPPQRRTRGGDRTSKEAHLPHGDRSYLLYGYILRGDRAPKHLAWGRKMGLLGHLPSANKSGASLLSRPSGFPTLSLARSSQEKTRDDTKHNAPTILF